MDHNAMENIIDRTFAQVKGLRETKGKEYATEEDTLADFKEVAEEAGITPYQVWATYVKKHERAIDTFIREGGVKSESIESRIVDVVVYHLLLLGLIQDLEEEENFVTDASSPPSSDPCMAKCTLPRAMSRLHEGETIVCELPRGHSTEHYGRTPQGHGFGFPQVELPV